MSKKEKNQHIQVYVRCRPQNAAEKKTNSQIVVEAVQETKEIVVKERLCDKDYSKKFTFDRVFGPDNTQLDVYKTVASPCIEEVLMGYNCTVFAYGQTGTGKTYTMEGSRSAEKYTWEEDPEIGIIPRTLSHLFDELKNRFQESTVRVSFLELYNEELFDLLSSVNDRNKLRLYDDVMRKGSVVIQGLSELTVHSKEEVYHIMELGTNRRRTASTLMNTDSSRSHAVFSITVHIRECNLEGEELLKTGKLNLVDLAGSECIGRSGAVDRRAREAGSINQSLLTLGRVITALIEKTPHIPYRESKLTRLLQDSLGGRTKTSIIATVSPAQCNLEETLSTLDYAHRAKNITNKPEINQKMTKKMLIREYTEEIQKLRADLIASRDKNGIYIDEENYNLMHGKLKTQKEEIQEKLAVISVFVNEMERMKLLFSQVQDELKTKGEELEVNTKKLDETTHHLHSTSKHLTVTSMERDEQQQLVNRHAKTEKLLAEQAQKILRVVEKSTSDADALQKKLLRKKHVEHQNEQQSENFQFQLQKNYDAFLENVNVSVVQQQQCHKQLSTAIDSTSTLLREQSQEMQGAMSTWLSCHNDVMFNQNDKMMQKEDDVQKLAEDILNRSLQHMNVSLETEENYLSKFHSPLNSELESLLLKQRSLKNKLMDDFQSTLEGQMKAIDLSHAKAIKTTSELRSTVLNFVDKQMPMISKCESDVQKGFTANENLFKTVSSYFDGLDKFVEFSASTNEQLQNQTGEISNNSSRISQQLNLIQEHKRTLPVAVHSSILSLVSETDKLHKICENDATQMETTTNDYISQDRTLNDELCKNLSKLEERVQSHSNSSQKAFDYHCKLACTSIEELQNQRLQNFPEERSDLDELGEIVQEGTELHKNVLDTQCTDRKDAAKKQELIVEDAKRVADELGNCVKGFLRQQDHYLDRFLHEELVKDIPTGETPQRKEYSYPRTLVSTSPHERILGQYRMKKQMDAAQILPLPDEYDSDKASGQDLSLL